MSCDRLEHGRQAKVFALELFQITQIHVRTKYGYETVVERADHEEPNGTVHGDVVNDIEDRFHIQIGVLVIDKEQV